jgi:hypothetical protein
LSAAAIYQERQAKPLSSSFLLEPPVNIAIRAILATIVVALAASAAAPTRAQTN